MTAKPEFTQAMRDWILTEARAVVTFIHSSPERCQACRAVIAEAGEVTASGDLAWHRAHEAARLALLAADQREDARRPRFSREERMALHYAIGFISFGPNDEADSECMRVLSAMLEER